MKELSQCEREVAMEFTKGLADKEVADRLNKSIWTIKAQKRDIYRKLGINKDTELLLYMMCDRAKRNFDIKEIRKHGIELFFSVLFALIQVSSVNTIDMRRMRTLLRPNTTASCVRVGIKNNNDLVIWL